ncbi:MAG: CPBP family intramembrane glutamic endopeptidase [Solirubrobacterales bacterium]
MTEPSLPPPAPLTEPPQPAPRPAAGNLPASGWGPVQALTGLALLLAVTLVQVGVISAFDSDLESLGARLAVQAGLAISLVAVAFAMAPPGTIADPTTLGMRRPVVPALRPSFLAYLTYVGCAILIALAIQPEQEDVTDQLGYGENALADVIVGMLVIGVAPFTEEVFFRGFMFAGLRHRLPFIAAAGISAGIWGLFHYTGAGTLGVVLQLAAFGVILSWLYERTGSIWPPVAVHVLNNALAFAILTS